MKLVPSSFLLPLCLGAAVFAAGCKPGQTPDPEPPAPVRPRAPAPASAPKPATPPASVAQPGPPPAAVSPRESNDAAYTREMTQTLNDFLGDYIKQNKRIPKDTDEMLRLKIITSVPPVPGGGKWVIDQQTGKISAR